MVSFLPFVRSMLSRTCCENVRVSLKFSLCLSLQGLGAPAVRWAWPGVLSLLAASGSRHGFYVTLVLSAKEKLASVPDAVSGSWDAWPPAW